MEIKTVFSSQFNRVQPLGASGVLSMFAIPVYQHET